MIHRSFCLLLALAAGLSLLPLAAAQDISAFISSGHDGDILNLKPNFERLAARGEIPPALQERMNGLTVLLATERPLEEVAAAVAAVRRDFPGLSPAVAPWLVFIESRMLVAAGNVPGAEKAVEAWAAKAPENDVDLAAKLRFYLARVYADDPEHTQDLPVEERLECVRRLAGGVFRDERVAGVLRLHAGLYLADQIGYMSHQSLAEQDVQDGTARRDLLLERNREREDVLREAERLCGRIEAALKRAPENPGTPVIAPGAILQERRRITAALDDIRRFRENR